MKLSKTCFPTKITMVKLTKTVNLLALTLLTTMTIATPAYADNTQTFTKDTTTCATTKICKALSQFIQAQIDELEAKENLSNDDKRLRYNLKKQLIAVETSETKLNENLITAENQKQKENSSLINSQLESQDSQISVLRGALLEN